MEMVYQYLPISCQTYPLKKAIILMLILFFFVLSDFSKTYRYFDLPFCSPDSIIKEKNEALGEVLNGDRLVSAPYKLNFRDDKESAVVCRKKLSKEEVVQFRNAVEKDYYFQMYYDDLPI